MSKELKLMLGDNITNLKKLPDSRIDNFEEYRKFIDKK